MDSRTSDGTSMSMHTRDSSLFGHHDESFAILSQDGTAQNDTLLATAAGKDGSVVLAGYSEGDWAAPNAGFKDFVAVKLASDGTEVWRWQVRRATTMCEGY